MLFNWEYIFPNLCIREFPEEKYSCETRVITTDFAGGMDVYASIKDQLKNLDIGILGELRVIVNCMSFVMNMYGLHWDVEVGMGYTTEGWKPVDSVNPIPSNRGVVQPTCT